MHLFHRVIWATLPGLGIAGFVSAASLSMTFTHPENYTDAAYSSPSGSDRERTPVQRDMEQHLRQLAERTLPPSQTLRIEVLDIDLAGHFEPFRSGSGADVRILRDVTPPRVRLRYTLAEGDKILASGEDQVADRDYLVSGSRWSGGDRLRYEKAMLSDWFERRMGTAASLAGNASK